LVEQIIEAGSLAPYDGFTGFSRDPRRFFVIPRESEATQLAAMLFNRRSVIVSELLEKQRQQNEFQKELGGHILKK
jgi:hypothetical protein